MLPNWPKEKSCLKEHTPLMPYVCPVCNEAYIYNLALADCLPIAEKLQKERDEIYKKYQLWHRQAINYRIALNALKDGGKV